ncbi:substrate-binding domain-containing protein [Collimonas humicola]|uniref:substrate-binding domain-containing protein n=1 Tax=Collimonas humicola TaxID=2825886 RepID=UPI001B8D3A75|nr:substrate-binding domain-containing protein [Collimonas humicola]
MSLKEIAKTLGLSVTTVSRALNGYPEVSEKTRSLVKAAAKAGGYSPNSQARSLVTGKMDAVGIIYPISRNDLGDPAFLETIASLAVRIDQADMDLVISSAVVGDELRAYRRMISRHRIDGLIVAQTLVHDPRLSFLLEQKFPFVAYGRSDSCEKYAWFDIDNQAGLKMAVNRLSSFGHRRIALINASTTLNFAVQRRAGYLEGLAEAAIAVDPAYIVDNVFDRRSGYSAMTKLLALAEPPTAIVVDNNLSGVGVMRALLDSGLVAGRDLSVIVYDDLPPDTLVGTTVTSIIQPEPGKIGQQLAEMMLALLAGEDPARLQVLWQPKIQVGTSDGPCSQ